MAASTPTFILCVSLCDQYAFVSLCLCLVSRHVSVRVCAWGVLRGRLSRSILRTHTFSLFFFLSLLPPLWQLCAALVYP